MAEAHKSFGSLHMIYDDDCLVDPDFKLFSAVDHNATDAKGLVRGSAKFFQYQGYSVVLKRYFRGGAIRHLSQDNYFYTGFDRTRMVREFRLLTSMKHLGLPVPRPIAALVERRPMLYSGCLLTEKISVDGTLADLTRRTTLSLKRWEEIGQCVAQFHHHGVFHSDLNAENILLNIQPKPKNCDISIIDFDKCYINPKLSANKRKANLDRLKRSLEKIGAWASESSTSRSEWQALLRGYQS